MSAPDTISAWRCALAAFAFALLWHAAAALESRAHAQQPAESCPPGEAAQRCYRRAIALAVDSVQVARTLQDEARETSALASARSLMASACDQGGYAGACYFHAQLLAARGDTTTDATSLALFQRACMMIPAHASACTRAGDVYLNGIGVAISYDSAVSFYYRACTASTPDPRGCYKAAVNLDLVMGLSRDERSQREIELSRRGCELGSRYACVSFGFYLDRDSTRDGSARSLILLDSVPRIYRAACEQGVPLGCNNLGAMFEAGRVAAQDTFESDRYYYLRACYGVERVGVGVERVRNATIEQLFEGEQDLSHHGMGCYNMADLYVDTQLDSAAFYYERGCSLLLHMDSCVALADLRGGDSDLTDIPLFQDACAMRNSWGCNLLGIRYHNADQLEDARTYYLRACELGSAYACSNVALTFNTGLTNVRAKYFRRGCELGDELGCSKLADLLDELEEPERAQTYYERGCSLSSGYSCWRARQWHAEHGNEQRASYYHAAACRSNTDYCKRKT